MSRNVSFALPATIVIFLVFVLGIYLATQTSHRLIGAGCIALSISFGLFGLKVDDIGKYILWVAMALLAVGLLLETNCLPFFDTN